MPTLTEQYNELAALMVESLGEADTADMMKSLATLIKFNQGKFKSDRQAKFIYKKMLLAKSPAAQRWGERWMRTKNAIACELTAHIKAFGHKEKSKIRYYGYLYVIDGGGIVRAAKAAIDHQGNFVVTGEKELLFQRKGNVPELYDHAAELDAQRNRMKTNAPLADKIKAAEGYDQNDFLQDMVWNLEMGRTLSPAQLKVVSKYVEVEVGDYAAWAQAFKEGMAALKVKLIEPGIKALKQCHAEVSAEPNKYEISPDAVMDMVRKFEDCLAWTKKPAKHEEMYSCSGVQDFIRELGYMGGNQGQWPFTGLWALNLVSKRKSKAGKATIKYIRDGVAFADWLKTFNPQRLVDAIRDFYLEPRHPDPYAHFYK